MIVNKFVTKSKNRLNTTSPNEHYFPSHVFTHTGHSVNHNNVTIKSYIYYLSFHMKKLNQLIVMIAYKFVTKSENRPS